MAIDWEAARARLEEVRQRLQQATATRAFRDRIMRRRAEALARPEEVAEVLDDEDAVLVLQAGGERFGIALEAVSEILAGVRLARVPGTRDEVAGVIQVRGEIRPVFQLAGLLGLRETQEDTDAEYVVLLRHGKREVGIRASHVDDIRTVPKGERHAPPAGLVHAEWMTSDRIPVLKLGVVLGEEA